jgi:hypothetical protein
MYTWAATNPVTHTRPGALEEALPLKGKHLAMAAAPFLYFWSLTALIIGFVLAGFGVQPLYAAAYPVLVSWPAGWRLAAVVLLGAALIYPATLPFRRSQARIVQLLSQAAQEQRLSGRAFWQLAGHTASWWCCLTVMILVAVLTREVSQIYP